MKPCRCVRDLTVWCGAEHEDAGAVCSRWNVDPHDDGDHVACAPRFDNHEVRRWPVDRDDTRIEALRAEAADRRAKVARNRDMAWEQSGQMDRRRKNR